MKVVHTIKISGRELPLLTWEHNCIKNFSNSNSANVNLKVSYIKLSLSLIINLPFFS